MAARVAVPGCAPCELRGRNSTRTGCQGPRAATTPRRLVIGLCGDSGRAKRGGRACCDLPLAIGMPVGWGLSARVREGGRPFLFGQIGSGVIRACKGLPTVLHGRRFRKPNKRAPKSPDCRHFHQIKSTKRHLPVNPHGGKGQNLSATHAPFPRIRPFSAVTS